MLSAKCLYTWLGEKKIIIENNCLATWPTWLTTWPQELKAVIQRMVSDS